MPPRRRLQYTQESIDQQLQQIHLLDASSSSENLEQLGPIIKQIHANRQQEVYLRNLQALIEAKDAEIEGICTENYQEFISSISTLFTIKSYTTSLRERIATLDENVGQLGKGLVEKKRTLLQSKKTASNLDEAIDTFQACLKLLDVIDRIGDMIKEGRFWSALRSLEDIQTMPLTSLSQTPLYQHILSSLPSLRVQVQNAVTASMKQWLLEIRNVTATVGRSALETMNARTRKWRARREKDPMLRSSRVGSAVEMVTYERTDSNVLDKDKIGVDFQPLYQCVHIYISLDSLDDLRTSYQADRKAQSDLILPTPLSISTLPALLEEICGFFIIESHVLETTSGFRSEREIEELWDGIVARLSSAIASALVEQRDPDTFLKVKECLTSFVMTLESYSYSTHSLHSLTLALFEKYTGLLETEFGRKLDSVVLDDDYLPMHVTTSSERESVLNNVWLSASEKENLIQYSIPLTLPWSQSFYLCCQDIRTFIQQFYQFVEGVSQHHSNIDDLLSRSLDKLLSNHISDSINKRLPSTSALSQIAQIVTNLEYFEVACTELGQSLTNLRSTQRGGTIRLASSPFSEPFQQSQRRITALITSKLDDFFDLSEYDWTPQGREEMPSMYLYELVNWLTTVVDSLPLKDTYKDEAYKGAIGYIAECFMNFMIGPKVPAMNEHAVANMVTDMTFLEGEITRIGRGNLNSSFAELHSMSKIILTDAVQDYLNPSVRQASYSEVRPKRLQALLEKLARYGATCRDNRSRERGERRRKEAETLHRMSLTYT
ncbi:exocyst complex subunit Sec15-like-domain-containing protein [Butyriboletus roseoflavus]|nr:exocyst complex subunit Sec15-like-domain-containing protein [Butyriboletus roseoflavus]